MSHKITKGDYGYFKKEKLRRALVTFVLFLIPLTAYFVGWAYFKTRMTIVTVIVVVGCLPACKSAVSTIMVLLHLPGSEVISANSGTPRKASDGL